MSPKSTYQANNKSPLKHLINISTEPKRLQATDHKGLDKQFFLSWSIWKGMKFTS